MQLDWTILRSGEQIMYRLRGLYERYGYRRFKMSKFEEYDLYVRNKDFLVSDRMITFTDARGILMALKPDVTLSIIKNTRAEEAGRHEGISQRGSPQGTVGGASLCHVCPGGLSL